MTGLLSSELGRTLGRLATRHDGLMALYLPPGTPTRVAATIVAEANRCRPEEVPFAILVSDDDEDWQGAGIPVVGRAAAIQYRQGDRLAVVPGSTVDIASFDGVFREVLGPGFPSTGTAGFDVTTLALRAAEMVVLESGGTEADATRAAEVLDDCMRRVAEVLREEREGAASWNSLWFGLVDSALTALFAAVRQGAANGSSAAATLERLGWAAFGLPQPGTAKRGSGEQARWAKRFLEALGARWASEELVEEVEVEANVAESVNAAALARCREAGWDGLNEEMALTPSRLVGLQSFVSADRARLDAFGDINEAAFFGAPSNQGTAIVLREDSTSASIGTEQQVPVYVLPSTEEEGGYRVSEPFRLRLPLLGPGDGLEAAGISVTLKVAGPRYQMGDIEEYIVVDGALEVLTSIASKQPVGDTMDKVRIAVTEDRGQGPRLLKAQTVALFLLPPCEACLVVAPATKTRVGTPHLVEPTSGTDDATAPSYDLRAGSGHRVALLGSGETAPRSTGVQLVDKGAGAWLGELPADTAASVAVGALRWELVLGGPAVSSHSVLLAAARGVTVDPDEPDIDVARSLLGRLESWMAACISDEDYLRHAGHVGLPTDTPAELGSLVPYDCALVPNGQLAWWRSVAKGPTQPHEDWLAAREEFVQAWRACTDRLLPVADEGSSVQWPSKRSTRPLWEEPQLVDDMLVAYTHWMQASHATPFHRFLATYPFSFSGWGLTRPPRPDVVLLSPWHPLRLAWMCGVEQTLHEADRAMELMGTVEGWGFPVLGRSHNKSKWLIGLPMETGQDDLFAGWSMMVSLSGDDEETLAAPAKLAGLPMPGTSASGLTASAADAALRDFRRVNSYLPSVMIDLASSVRGRRMAQVDRSVLRAVKAWARPGERSRTPLLGIEVLDSLNRQGDIPRDEVLELLAETGDTTVAWKRYAPTPEKPVRSNLRLLQDSGVAMILEDAGGGESNGIVGRLPLRRFEMPSSARHTPAFQPAVPPGESPFERALAAVEQPDGLVPVVGLAVDQSTLASDESDWTISGDAFVPAAVLAREVANKNTEHSARMLWEWRPPFLTASAEAKLNRRPYASVMRVGSQLVDKVVRHLHQVDPEAAIDAPGVLSTLGSQSIGLASLLTTGGQHPAGALGFYLALELMKRAAPAAGEIQLVLPIDASRQFLDVLSGGQRSADTTRQADLLVLRASEGKVNLVPVEIKMYGLDTVNPQPLATTPSELRNPLEQLQATRVLLGQMQAERGRLVGQESWGELALWDNALASLVEAGLRLTESNWDKRAVMRAVVESIVNGEYQLEVALPIVLFFSHDPQGGDEFVALTEDKPSGSAPDGFAALSARPSSVMRALHGDAEGDVVQAWAAVVDWAAARGRGDVPTPARPREVDEAEDPQDDVEDAPVEDVVPRRAALVDADPDEGAPVRGASSPDQTTGSSRGASTQGTADGGAEDVVVSTPPYEERKEESLPSLASAGSEVVPAHKPGGVRIPLGTRLGGISSFPVEYWPSNTNTTQLNMGIVGDLGTGKTQLLKSLLTHVRHASRDSQEKPTTGLIFDYKRDFQDQAFVSAVGATVWKPVRMPLNVLQLRESYSPRIAFKRASAFVSMLERIYSGIGPVQRDRLTEVIVEAFAERGGAAPTLGTVLAGYKELVPGGDSVTGILRSFVMGEVFSEDEEELVTLAEAMEDTVLVIDLNDLGADSNLKNAIVVLFLDMFYEEMKNMVKVPPRQEDGVSIRNISSYLLVDEASNIMRYDFEVLESLLKEGREFGVGVILASQFLSHFKSAKTNFAEALSTWFVHKVPNVTAKELSNLGIVGADAMLADRIKTLQVHQSLYKSDLSPAGFVAEQPFWRLVADEGLASYRKACE